MSYNKRARCLAEDYELGDTQEDFFNYIVKSQINGQKKQVRSLFNEMATEDKRYFLTDWLDLGEEHSLNTYRTIISMLWN